MEKEKNILLLKGTKALAERVLYELKKNNKEESEKSTVGSSVEDVLKAICECCDITSTHNLDK
jgi:hypothetical protein